MRTFLSVLTSIGVFLVFLLGSWFPYISIYDFTLSKTWDALCSVSFHPEALSGYGLLAGMPENTVPFRLKITIASIIIAAVLMTVMFLLRRACGALNQKLYEKVLLWGLFYVGVMTVIMLTGLWLDFQVDSVRVGFFFYG